MPEIVLATLNAGYIHASFGLRCLRANLGDLRARSALVEFTTNQRLLEIAEAILAQRPRILGLGVFVWNVAPSTALVALLKRIRPELVVILGGPEVSYECDQQEIVRLADHVLTGEAQNYSGCAARPRPRGAAIRRIYRRRHRAPVGVRRSVARLPV
jgi:hypothetical protein